MEVWNQDGYAGIADEGLPEHVCYINPERGTGQGDVSSPQTWVVFFLHHTRTLELENEDSLVYLSENCALTRTPDLTYADDLFSVAATQNGLQRKANVASTCAILGVKIAQAKLRVFSIDWTALPSQRSRLPQDFLTVYALGGTAHTIPIKQGCSVNSLGVHYDMDNSGSSMSTSEGYF